MPAIHPSGGLGANGNDHEHLLAMRADRDRLYFGGYPHRGLKGRFRRLVKEATQELLLRLAVRRNLYLASGPFHGETPIDPEAFGRGLWSQSSDYVRHGTLQLLLHELDRANVPGARLNSASFRATSLLS